MSKNTYRGCEINLNRTSGKWEVSRGGMFVGSADTEEKAMTLVDNAKREENKARGRMPR